MYNQSGCGYCNNSNYSIQPEPTQYTTETKYTTNTLNYDQNTNYTNNTHTYSNNYHLNTPQQPIISTSFLNENRPTTPIITDLKEIREIIQKTYRTITNEEIPDEIQIQILNEKEFKKLPIYSPGLAGFCYNGYGKGISKIIVKQDHLDSLLLTIGHEIGHVLSPTLPNKHDEEAKAHAFSLTWMETIRDNNNKWTLSTSYQLHWLIKNLLFNYALKEVCFEISFSISVLH